MRRAAILLLLFLCAAPPVPAASETPEDHRHVDALRSLSVNRSLLERYEEEYRRLMEADPGETEPANARRLSDLRFKIQALKEDAERLSRSLPQDKDAGSLLEEVSEKKSGHKGVDVEADRRVSEKLREVYRLHEKALALAASKRWNEAAHVYEEITLVSPDDDEAYLLLGHSSLAAGQYERAANAFRNAIHIDPANLLEIPRLYENILVENPADGAAMTRLGYAHLLLGNADKARLAFEDALDADPSNLEARRGLLELAV